MSRLAHRLRAPTDLCTGKVSASLTGCWLREMEKLWVQPAHRGAERGTSPSPAVYPVQAPCCSQTNMLLFLLAQSSGQTPELLSNPPNKM